MTRASTLGVVLVMGLAGFTWSQWWFGAVSPSARSTWKSLSSRLDLGRRIDLLDLEEEALRAAQRWPDLAMEFRALSAEVAAQRYLEFGGDPTDRERAKSLLSGVEGVSRPPFLAMAVGSEPRDRGRLVHRLRAASRAPAAMEALAFMAWAEGNVEEALALQASAVDRAPQRDVGRRRLALMLAQTGAHQAASEAWAATEDSMAATLHTWTAQWAESGRLPPWPPLPSLAHPDERGRAAMLGAAAALVGGRREEAYQLLEAALEAYPGSVDYRLTLGDLMLLGGWPERALLRFREAMALEPDSLEVRRALARAQLAARVGRCRPAEVLEFGRVRPDPGRFRLVRVEFELKIFPEDLYQLIGSDPARWEAGFGAANRVALARLCLTEDRAPKATRYLESAAAKDARLVRPELRIRALLMSGRAAAALRISVEEPHSAEVSLLRAQAYEQFRDHRMVLEELQPVLTSTATIVPQAYELAARASLELGDLGAAERWLAALRQLRPKATGTAWLTLDLARIAGDEARALSAAGTLLRDPTTPWSQLMVGMSHPQAILLARTAAKVRPTMQLMFYELAARNGDLPEEDLLQMALLMARSDASRARGRALLRLLSRSASDRSVRSAAGKELRR